MRTDQTFQLLFLDWKMAFDKVNHDSLVRARKRLGIHSHYLDAVGLHGDEAHGTLHTGIRQGCPLSPYLFMILMTVLMSDVYERLLATGVPWSVTKHV